jgi:GNAT superfamily N-acetyltransferase
MAHPTPSIRRATSADGPAFLALVQALADYEHLPPPPPEAQQRLLCDAFGERPRFDLFLAEVGGQVVAYAVVFETYSTFLARPTLYLEDIFVLPEHRRRGVGDALFRFCMAETLRRGCGRMEWAVLDWNTPAISFYEKQGAKRLREWLPYRLTREQIEGLSAQESPAMGAAGL